MGVLQGKVHLVVVSAKTRRTVGEVPHSKTLVLVIIARSVLKILPWWVTPVSQSVRMGT